MAVNDVFQTFFRFFLSIQLPTHNWKQKGTIIEGFYIASFARPHFSPSPWWKKKYCTNYYTNLVIINRLCHHIPIFLFLLVSKRNWTLVIVKWSNNSTLFFKPKKKIPCHFTLCKNKKIFLPPNVFFGNVLQNENLTRNSYHYPIHPDPELKKKVLELTNKIWLFEALL